MESKLKYKDLLNDFIIQNNDKSGQALFQLGLMHFYGKSYPQNITKGLKIIKQSAKIYPYAYTFLGHIYINGEQVLPDEEKGLKYLEKAVSLDNPEGLIQLSNIYLQNEIVPYNPGYAISLLERAIKLNSDEAMVQLGILYMDSPFLEPNYQAAFDLFTKAGKLGNPNAFSFLGVMYENGDYVKQNNNTALINYLKAAAKNSTISHFFLGRVYLIGDIVKRNIPEAVSHLQLAADLGHIEAMKLLIDVYLDELLGFYFPQKAIIYLQDLVRIYDTSSMYIYGKLLIEGKHTKKDVKEGLNVLRDANTVESYLYLGSIYFHGLYVPKCINISLEYYLKVGQMGSSRAVCEATKIILKEQFELNPIPLLDLAIKTGDPESYYLYGICYLNGMYVDKNEKKGLAYINKAIKNNIAEAKFTYASLLLEGTIVPVNIIKAISLLKSSLRQNYFEASLVLYTIYNNKDYEIYDFKKANHYFNIALKNHVGEAYYILALQKINENLEEGISLLKKSIKLGYKEAKITLKEYMKK